MFGAICCLVECEVGAVSVLDGTMLVAIFSERELMKRVINEAREPGVTSTYLQAVSPGHSSEDAMQVTQTHSIRRLPEWRNPRGLPLATRSAAVPS